MPNENNETGEVNRKNRIKYRCGCELEQPNPSPNPNFCLICYNALWRHALPNIPNPLDSRQ